VAVSWRAAAGLQDYSDPNVGRVTHEKLAVLYSETNIHSRGVRFRNTGYREIIEAHFLFPHQMPVGEDHRLATNLEERSRELLPMPEEVVTHLESLKDYAGVHSEQH